MLSPLFFPVFGSVALLGLMTLWRFYGFIALGAFGEVRLRGHLWPVGAFILARGLLEQRVCV